MSIGSVSDQPSSSIQIIIITAVLVSAALLVIIGVRIYLMSGRRRGGKSSKVITIIMTIKQWKNVIDCSHRIRAKTD